MVPDENYSLIPFSRELQKRGKMKVKQVYNIYFQGVPEYV